MQSAKEIFSRIVENKKKLKDLKGQFRDECMKVPEYVELIEKKSTIVEKIGRVKQVVEEANRELVIQIDDLKIDIASDKEMLGDLVMSTMIKGETVELTDVYENKYQLAFTFNFKREK